VALRKVVLANGAVSTFGLASSMPPGIQQLLFNGGKLWGLGYGTVGTIDTSNGTVTPIPDPNPDEPWRNAIYGTSVVFVADGGLDVFSWGNVRRFDVSTGKLGPIFVGSQKPLFSAKTQGPLTQLGGVSVGGMIRG